MQAPQTLRRPANWQDFETLCLKLWGEIWDCHEIKKNGRTGQKQHGVDVYGTPSWDSEYYGIQCKGKDEYTDKQFTTKEIDEEIEKAKAFKPKLKKLYFATTAVRDVATEEYIREKNLEHKREDLFEVHLFSWEDIVERIDENKQTHDWYVKNQNYKSTQAVEVTFGDGSKEITLEPRFSQQKTFYTTYNLNLPKIAESIALIFRNQYNFAKAINKSYVGFYIRIQNTGKEPIEDYKLLIKFKGDIQHLADTNEKEGTLSIHVAIRRKFSTYLYPDSLEGRIIPFSPRLVGEDNFESEYIFIKPSPIEKLVTLEWKLISRNFKADGILAINLNSCIDVTRKFVTVTNKTEERTVDGEYSDYIIQEEND